MIVHRFNYWNYRLLYIVNVTLGAHAIILNRENNSEERFDYIGTTKQLTYTYRWDTVNPYHCSVLPNNSCSPFLSVSDLTEMVSWLIFCAYIGKWNKMNFKWIERIGKGNVALKNTEKFAIFFCLKIVFILQNYLEKQLM